MSGRHLVEVILLPCPLDHFHVVISAGLDRLRNIPSRFEEVPLQTRSHRSNVLLRVVILTEHNDCVAFSFSPSFRSSLRRKLRIFVPSKDRFSLSTLVLVH